VDLVWFVTVLQHLTQKRMLGFALSECRRVLKPGGTLFAFENTHKLRSGREIAYRPQEEYVRLLSAVGKSEALGKLTAEQEAHTAFLVTKE
jgi:SAM-dependent methyltransferase